MNDPGIVCPFCPLHCDDVSIAGPLDCSILRKEVDRLQAEAPLPRVGSDTVTVENAMAAARACLSDAGPATLLVSSATISQAKAIVESGFLVAIESSETSVAVQKATARCGTITATLADIKQHADQIVLLGNVEQTIPRLMEQLGDPSCVESSPTPNADSIAEMATAIRQGNLFADRSYVAFLLDSTALNANDADAAVELLIETILWMNSAGREKRQRAVLVSLDPLASLRCVSAWSDGKRLPVSTPSDFNGRTIRLGEPGTDHHSANIQIGRIDPGSELAGIYLPASTPGIHHIDSVIRGDGTVTLPLGKVQKSNSLSAADVISRLS